MNKILFKPKSNAAGTCKILSDQHLLKFKATDTCRKSKASSICLNPKSLALVKI